MYDDASLSVDKIDTYTHSSPPAFGLNVSERLFWEAYVMIQDCSRPLGTEWDIGRKSEVSAVSLFQLCLDMLLFISLLLRIIR